MTHRKVTLLPLSYGCAGPNKWVCSLLKPFSNCSITKTCCNPRRASGIQCWWNARAHISSLGNLLSFFTRALRDTFQSLRLHFLTKPRWNNKPDTAAWCLTALQTAGQGNPHPDQPVNSDVKRGKAERKTGNRWRRLENPQPSTLF